MKFGAVDDLIGPEHPARAVDAVVGRLDLEPLLARWKVFEGAAGRPVTSPRMLLSLWIYAVSVGVGSAREIERRTRTDDAFAWLVGDMRPSHDVIAEFRVQQGAAFSRLLTDVVTALVDQDVVSLGVVAQDGTRVRASASAPSFRREEALLELREQARLHVAAVLAQADDPEVSAAAQAARVAKAKEFQRRVEAALAVVVDMQDEGKPADEARASTTDVDARVMKMGDGGFRPAYNVQLAVAGGGTGGASAIVGVRVTNVGSDFGSVTPMLDDIEARTGSLPTTLLADANHSKLTCIEEAHQNGVVVIAPTKRSRGVNPRRDERLKNEGPGVTHWRERMTTEAAKGLYKQRAAMAELKNAQLKGKFGLQRFPVRGLARVTSTTMLYALAMNIVLNAEAMLR